MHALSLSLSDTHSLQYLLVRVLGINGGLWLVAPDALVEGLQEGPLQQGQSPPHLSSTQTQSLLTLGRLPETQRTQLAHLHTPETDAVGLDTVNSKILVT